MVLAEGIAVTEVVVVGPSLGFVDEIECLQQEQRLVGPLVRTTLFDRRGAGMECVEPFNGLIESHG